MKEKLSLMKLNEMNEKETSEIKGGNCCSCSCYYAYTENGADFIANRNANYRGNKSSLKGNFPKSPTCI